MIVPNLSEAESLTLRIVKSGYIQEAPVVERLICEGLLARFEAWRVVHRLVRRGLLEESTSQKKDRLTSRTIRIKVLQLTKKGEELFNY